jgi:hypothetical protein
MLTRTSINFQAYKGVIEQLRKQLSEVTDPDQYIRDALANAAKYAIRLSQGDPKSMGNAIHVPSIFGVELLAFVKELSNNSKKSYMVRFQLLTNHN